LKIPFGIEFALKTRYFYNLIIVSEKIPENTSVDIVDPGFVAGIAVAID